MVPLDVGPIIVGSEAKSKWMSLGATSFATTQEPKAKDLKTKIDECLQILLCWQNDIANEQKNDYNRLRHKVYFYVTELEKMVNVQYKTESESEEEEEEGNEDQGGDEEESKKEEDNEEE